MIQIEAFRLGLVLSILPPDFAATINRTPDCALTPCQLRNCALTPFLNIFLAYPAVHLAD
jgi:hypothetical protein